ncbi:MFS transporter [Orbus sturtevantii]|uniref:MFS transporter n=1 Tax=Orbus sturtevantii TaxID=3074109 RepID=UPI00370D55B5
MKALATTKTLSAKTTFKNLRWLILILFLSGVTVNYITRNSLGILASELISDLSMTTQEYSYIVAAFQFAYTIFQPLCGWFIDFIGLKLGFFIFAVIWSVACIFHAGAANWIELAILRFFMGGAEAAATPANAKILSEWFPKKERPVAAGWAGVGFSIGAMLAPPIIVVFHIALGWQGAFIISGILALIWSFIWIKFYTSPEKNRHLSQEELKYIKQDNESEQAKLPFLKSLSSLVKMKKFYGICIPAFLAEPAWATFSFWVPLYLAQEKGMDIKQIAMFAWLPFLAADIGSIASGYLTKLYIRLFGYTRINSIIASSITGAFLMVSLAFVAITQSPYIAILLISIGGFGHQVISCMLSALVVDSFDKNQVATMNGMRGSSAWIASFIFSLIIGAFSQTIGFGPLFIVMGFLDLIGAIFLVSLIWEKKQKITGIVQ